MMEFNGHRIGLTPPHGKSPRPHKPPIDVRNTKTCFLTAADLVLVLEAAQRQGRYREVMHHAVNSYKLL
jgi:hypothetical protein